MALYYHCKMCGQEHKTTLRFVDKKAFDTWNMNGTNILKCPKANKSAGYIKSELIWKDR